MGTSPQSLYGRCRRPNVVGMLVDLNEDSRRSTHSPPNEEGPILRHVGIEAPA